MQGPDTDHIELFARIGVAMEREHGVSAVVSGIPLIPYGAYSAIQQKPKEEQERILNAIRERLEEYERQKNDREETDETIVAEYRLRLGIDKENESKLDIEMANWINSGASELIWGNQNNTAEQTLNLRTKTITSVVGQSIGVIIAIALIATIGLVFWFAVPAIPVSIAVIIGAIIIARAIKSR